MLRHVYTAFLQKHADLFSMGFRQNGGGKGAANNVAVKNTENKFSIQFKNQSQHRMMTAGTKR